jgi:cytochrome c556
MTEQANEQQENQSLEHWRASYEAMREERDALDTDYGVLLKESTAELRKAKDEAEENWQSFKRVKAEKEAVEATVARLREALRSEVQLHRVRNHHGQFDNRCDRCFGHESALSASPTGENSKSTTTI